MQQFLDFVQPFLDFSHTTGFTWLLIGCFVAYILADKAVNRKALTELRTLRERCKTLESKLQVVDTDE